MATQSKSRIVLGVATSYLLISFGIVYLARIEALSIQQAGLMLVAQFGLYVAIGILVTVYRLITKLE